MDNILFFILGFFSAFFLFSLCFLFYQKFVVTPFIRTKENMMLQQKISELAAHVVVICGQLEAHDVTKNIEKEKVIGESLFDRIARIHRENVKDTIL